MRPGNKFQRNLVEVDKSLPKLTSTQKNWGLKHCLMHEAVRLKSGKITCLDCGAHWQSPFTSQGWQVCPNCKTKLKIKTTRSRVFADDDYFTILTTHKGFQVIRKFYVKGYYKSGRKANTYVKEISKIYIAPTGKYGIIGYSFMSNYYGERWFGSFNLKHNRTIGTHSFRTNYVYPRKKFIPIIIQNGFLSDTHTLTYFNFFYAILTKPKAETLLKAKHFSLFKSSSKNMNYKFNYPYEDDKIEKHWQSIKICIRQNYFVKDASDWLDYLDLLEFFGRDLSNYKYVCPANFKKEHDRYVEKKRKILLKQNIEKRKAQLRIDQKKYKKAKKQYFDLSFTDGKIVIKVIDKVKKVLELGNKFRHCIYTNSYYEKENSLLLYASVDNVPVETIEFDLQKFKVIQSRGFLNDPTKFHKKIIKLVDSHAKDIKKIAV